MGVDVGTLRFTHVVFAEEQRALFATARDERNRVHSFLICERTGEVRTVRLRVVLSAEHAALIRHRIRQASVPRFRIRALPVS